MGLRVEYFEAREFSAWTAGEEKIASRVETGWCSVVGCNLCGWFFRERDERLRARMDFGLAGIESESSNCESNRPDRVEWSR
jgi:hypothetical protein